MWVSLIIGLASLATAVWQGEQTKNSNRRARNEDKRLSMTARQDALGQQVAQRRLDRKALGLRQQDLSFQQKMQEDENKLVLEQEQREKNVANRNFRKQVSDNLFGDKAVEKNLYLTGKTIGRFA